MLSCIKATELMEQKELMPLSLLQKVQLQMHVAMCSGCRNYMKQTALINKLLNKTFNSVLQTDTATLEEKILSKIS
ncbi:anti-sigma factor family protein [Flavisolibacter nicotianae]